MPAEQLTFFSSLDFPGRTTLSLAEIAEKLGCTVQHLLNEVDHGALVGLNIATQGVARRAMRVPVECYRTYVLSKLTGPIDVRLKFLTELPLVSRTEVACAIYRSLSAGERRALLAQLHAA